MCQRYFQILLLIVDKYISPSEKESLVLDNIVESIKSGESCTLRLIHSGDVMCFCVFFINESNAIHSPVDSLNDRLKKVRVLKNCDL